MSLEIERRRPRPQPKTPITRVKITTSDQLAPHAVHDHGRRLVVRKFSGGSHFVINLDGSGQAFQRVDITKKELLDFANAIIEFANQKEN